MNDNVPLYSSRLIKQVSEHLVLEYPDIDLDALYEYAGLTSSEVNDPGYWVTQRQSDLFCEAIGLEIDEDHYVNNFSRHIDESISMGPLRQYGLSLIGPKAVYLSIGRLMPMVSRGVTVAIRSLGPNTVEITTTPKDGVHEKLYQCEFRQGALESFAKPFTGKYAQVDHSECIFKGDPHCRYIVEWEITPDLKWKKRRNLSVLFAGLISLTTFFPLPISIWGYIPVACTIIVLLLSTISVLYKTEILSESIQHQGKAAKGLIEEINTHHDHSLFFQKVGLVTASPRYVRETALRVIHLMQEHLDFQSGFIMLPDDNNTFLQYTAGYGVPQKQVAMLRQIRISASSEAAQNIYQQCFKGNAAMLTNNIDGEAFERPMTWKPSDDTRSLICVPIVYEFNCYGVLVVANTASMRDLNQADLNTVKGISSQLALSIANTDTFNRLVKSEKTYRNLIENTSSIIMRQTPDGNITFFNEFARNYFGYTEEEVLGKNVMGILFPETDFLKDYIHTLSASLLQNPEYPIARETTCLKKNGSWGWVAWTHKPIFDEAGELIEIVCVGNDITFLKSQDAEKKDLESQLEQTREMETMGTFAGGIAHDFNNIIGSIILNTELAYNEAKGNRSARYALTQVLQTGREAGDIVKRILSFTRMSDIFLTPLHIADSISNTIVLLKAMLPSTIVIMEEIDCRDAVVVGDDIQIQELIINLCKNAAQSMERNLHGCIKICLSMSGSCIRLSVKDNGSGISSDIMDRIFHPYFTTRYKSGGKGLGLSIVQRIVKAHQGEIDVESWPDVGTAVHVYLPVEKPLSKNAFSTTIRNVMDQRVREKNWAWRAPDI